jgi:predicted thioesterase
MNPAVGQTVTVTVTVSVVNGAVAGFYLTTDSSDHDAH